MINKILAKLKLALGSSSGSGFIDSSVQHLDLVHQDARIQFSNLSGPVKIGANCVIHKAEIHGEVEVGNNTTINGPGTDIHTLLHPVTIGSFCSIASNTFIREHGHNYKAVTNYFIKYHVLGGNYGDDVVSKGPIVIENDVWIGTQSVILPGVTIGNGALIGANSVVDRDVPAYAIVAGSPAKVIKYRFETEVIARLMQIEWWHWSLDRIRRNQELFEGDLTMEKLNNLVE